MDLHSAPSAGRDGGTRRRAETPLDERRPGGWRYGYGLRYAAAGGEGQVVGHGVRRREWLRVRWHHSEPAPPPL